MARFTQREGNAGGELLHHPSHPTAGRYLVILDGSSQWRNPNRPLSPWESRELPHQRSVDLLRHC